MAWSQAIALHFLFMLLTSHLLFAGIRARPGARDFVFAPASQPAGNSARVEELFVQAMRRIWLETGAGVEEYEAGFALNRIGDDYVILFAPMTYERNLELRIPINTLGTTVAIAHTHPNSGQDVPSGADHFSPGHGDVFSPVPNYVVSRSGIWVTNPVDHSYLKLSGPSWSHRLRALALAGILNPPAPNPASAISAHDGQSASWAGEAYRQAWGNLKALRYHRQSASSSAFLAESPH